MPDEKAFPGSIVAFEGHPETVSTQLRLLPTSPHILILPSVQCYLPPDDPDSEDDFDARIHIKKFHNAALARDEAAQAFLRDSTPSNKRLVFMNGGTPGAQACCIRAIAKHETNGSTAKAQAFFDRLVKGGVTGLERSSRDWCRNSTLEYLSDLDSDHGFEDPITRAMRAADALDRQTASLQSNDELDLTSFFRPRSNSLPLYGYADNFGDAAPFMVFGAQKQQNGPESLSGVAAVERVPARTPKSPVTHYQKLTGKSYSGLTHLLPPSPILYSPRSPACVGESYEAVSAGSSLHPDVFTPRSEFFTIRSTDNVVYGEAAILDMRLNGQQAALTKVKSMDRLYTASPKYRDLCLPSDTPDPLMESPRLDDEKPMDSRRHSCLILSNAGDSLSSQLHYIEGPRTIVVRSNRPVIKMAPVPDHKKRRPARPSYVDRGTDADNAPEKQEDSFKPVLPFAEDLLIYFKDEVPDALLDLALRGYQNGSYPVTVAPRVSPERAEANASAPGTPQSVSINGSDCVQESFQEPAVVPRSSYTDEYDPFAYIQPTWPQPKPLSKVPTFKVQRPPTPAQTPPPPASGHEGRVKVHEFSISSQETAVFIQNSLRSILTTHFPAETQGYRQFQFPLLPELEGLWRPMFRQAEPGQPRDSHRKMDQIVAIGAQRGVKKDYSSAIIGQLEKLGTKSSGMSRSGRLDFRYLLANAMQAFTAQPLTSQTHDNPFTNSYLLATLIVPHLETYLALHSEVKFLLLEYPPEHLPTIMALQKLVGVGLMKVAQIVDSKNQNALPFTHIRGASITGLNQNGPGRFGSSLNSSQTSPHDITASKANFLLTSTASESEVATFISTVNKILAEISPYYTPEVPPKKPSPRKTRPSPLQGTFSPFPRITSGPQSPPVSPAITGRFGSGPPMSPSFPPSQASSVAETSRTFKSSRSRHSQTWSRNGTPSGDGQSLYSDDLSDGEWDMEDRRLMPMLVQKPDFRKGNSRKALKFLGLA